MKYKSDLEKRLQNLFNFVHDNLGKDDSVIGLCGLKKKTEYVYVSVPREFKTTFIQNTEKNYLLF